MTAFTSDQIQAAGTVTTAAAPVDAELNGQPLRMKYAKFDPAGAVLAQNDTIDLFTLPKGSVPIAWIATWEDFGSSVTLDLGTSASATLFDNGIDISSAGSQAWTLVDDRTQLAAEITVMASLLDANPTDDKELEVWFFYAGQN